MERKRFSNQAFRESLDPSKQKRSAATRCISIASLSGGLPYCCASTHLRRLTPSEQF
jgi:hypothetical protein